MRPGDRVRAAGAIGTLPPIPASEPRVLVAQGIGITPFLSMARSSGHLHATLLHVGTPHFFEETAAAMGAAEHHEHRDGLVESVRRAVANRPSAQWSLSGRPGFITAVAQQLRETGVPARRIHKGAFWGQRASTTGSLRASSTTAAALSR